MRSGLDRLRHAILFEIIALVLVTPVASALLEKDMDQTAAFAVGMCLIAMGWNALYNWCFDIALLRAGRPLQPRGMWLRAFHAVVFELGLFFVAIPFAMVMLDMNFMEALMAEVGLVTFYLAYAYLYNWAYDLVFPMPVEAVAFAGSGDGR
ncbi:PACE efflux transporter [Desulfovibrio mangrovi]|uniref:PACE efflux transporter n=1 Tax=Desulfovibrio mangrovi TaxID=2976983 RepID=UPI0022452DFB|nr:PACE efflux transporter [Desulfovibrio mangrovi]UZP66114.1 PACE efflux transporter [Desulfovibrio mangrovi]